MNVLFPVIALWISFLFAFGGYLVKQKKFRRMFFSIAAGCAGVTLLLFLWWAVLRALGSAA